MSRKIITIAYILVLIPFFSCTKVSNVPIAPKSLTQKSVKVNNNLPVVLYGDTRNNYDVHRKIVKAFLEKNPTIVFNTGDLVHDGDDDSLWPILIDIIKPVMELAKYYPVLGNHERNSNNYFKLFDLPNNERWYYVDYKDIRFFTLDSNSDLSIGSKQYLWLENELSLAKAKYKILIFHHPLYSVGRHGGEIHLRTSLEPLIEKYDVKLVFNGHDHAYARLRKGNTTYIVTGGGGAPLYDKKVNSDDEKFLIKYLKVHHYCLLELNEEGLLVRVYDLNNVLIDTVKID